MRTETFRIAILHHNLWTAGSGDLLFVAKAHLEVAVTTKTYIRTPPLSYRRRIVMAVVGSELLIRGPHGKG